jgi:hypothetical protein
MKLTTSPEDLARLQRQLDAAFDGLPIGVRKVLRACCPAFHLLSECEVEEGCVLAAWVEETGCIAFRGPLVVQFDEKALATLVAYQAAQAVLLAIGGDRLNEEAVDALATRWGYDMNAIAALCLT